jgi:hypothetical protein
VTSARARANRSLSVVSDGNGDAQTAMQILNPCMQLYCSLKISPDKAIDDDFTIVAACQYRPAAHRVSPRWAALISRAASRDAAVIVSGFVGQLNSSSNRTTTTTTT